MKIGLIVPPSVSVPPVAHDGTAAVVDGLARGLQAAGHDVVLLTTGDSAYPARSDCDLIHDHTMLGPFFAPGDVPVVTTNHDPFNADMRDICRAFGGRVPVIARSHAQRSLLISASVHEPAERLYFDEGVRPRLGGRIEFVGEASHAQKLALMGGARALLHPITWAEPFGLVMVEALACGTPVLAYPNGAAPEIVKHGSTGFLCPGAEAMAAAVRKIASLDRPACRAVAEGHFSSRRMAADHLALYRALLRQPPLRLSA